ncbi:MAG: hypothetical protein WCK29_02035 [archaeon]
MPADMQKLILEKENIIKNIQAKGPSLPIQIAREANLNLLFASAYLSELYSENKVKMSNMKVGSSSLYYIPGQETMLENFIQYLNPREKEAFNLLKSQKILEDDKVEPALRVALRSIKDFAIPLKVKNDSEPKLYWKHSSVTDEEAKSVLQNMLNIPEKKQSKKHREESSEDKQEKLEEEPEEKQSREQSNQQNQIANEKRDETIEQLKQKLDELSSNFKKTEKVEHPVHPTSKKEKKQKIIEDSSFVKNLKSYLSHKQIELLETRENAKKEFLGKISIDSLFGKQEFLLIAKDKKKVTEEDITLALHKAQIEKMPALFMSPGEIDKKATDHANTWKNLVRFEKIKF